MGKATEEYVKKHMTHREISLALIEQGLAKAPATKEEKQAEWERLQTAGEQGEIRWAIDQLAAQPRTKDISVSDLFKVLALFEWQQVNQLRADPAFWPPEARELESDYWRKLGRKPNY